MNRGFLVVPISIDDSLTGYLVFPLESDEIDVTAVRSNPPDLSGEKGRWRDQILPFLGDVLRIILPFFMNK